MTTEDRLAQIAERVTNASPTPWGYEIHADGRAWINHPGTRHALGLHGYGRDAVLIAHAPNDLAAMHGALAAVLALLDKADAKPGPEGERRVNTVVIRAAISAALQEDR
jgi:hypothetical protein